MGFFRGPNIVTDGLIYAIDAGSERSYPRLTPPAVWYDYQNGLGLGRYSIVNSVQPYSIRLNTSYASWVGQYQISVPTAENYTLMFDYVADASSQLVIDNDGIDDNNWNATLGVTTTTQTYSATKATTTTGTINFYTRRVNGGNITISNFRFFKSDPVNNIVGSNPATLYNGISFGTANGGRWDFDGVSDYGILPNSAIPNGNEITISFWNEIDTVQNSSIIAGTTGTVQNLNVHLTWSDGNVYWDCGDGQSTTSRIAYTPTAAEKTGWHNWVFQKNVSTGEMKMYMDGSLKKEDTGKTSAIPTMTLVTLGRFFTNAYYYNGKIANTLIYNEYLTAAEVLQNYNAQKSRFA